MGPNRTSPFGLTAMVAALGVWPLVGCTVGVSDMGFEGGDTGVGDTGANHTGEPTKDDPTMWLTGVERTSTTNGYILERALAGSPTTMEGMDHAFEVTFTTLAESGDCGDYCDWPLPDGSYVLGHDADYFEEHGAPGYGAIFYDGNVVYITVSDHEGHDVVFSYAYDNLGTFDQDGYWDLETR